MNRTHRTAALSAAAVLYLAAGATAQLALRDIGTLAPDDPAGTIPFAISKDGTTIIGHSGGATPGQGTKVFRWTQAAGIQEVVNTNPAIFGVDAFYVNGDGTVIAGLCTDTSGNPETYRPVRWTQATGFQFLDVPANLTWCSVKSISGSGVIAGLALDPTCFGYRLITWSPSSNLLPCLDTNFVSTDTASISRDGSQIALTKAVATDPARPIHAFKAGSGGGTPVDLGLPPPPVGTGDRYGDAAAAACNADGTVVFGSVRYIFGLPLHGSRTDVVRWNGTAAQDLGPPPSGDVQVMDVSDDGNVAVGGGFVWTSAGGMQSPTQYLASRNIEPGVWESGGLSPVGVSGDGKTLVFHGRLGTFDRAYVIGPCEDKDGDGICDDWEVNGIPYLGVDGAVHRYLLDINGDGISDANPLRKDIFVEVDAMLGASGQPGFTPNPRAIERVVAAFDSAPVPAPAIPGGLPGISLHVLVDDLDIPNRPYNTTNPTTRELDPFIRFQQDKNHGRVSDTDSYGFGTKAERANVADWPAIREAKALAFRYCIFADYYDNRAASGWSEIGGNDFMVTLGDNWPAGVGPAWATATGDKGGDENVQAGTFMHELGHALGLRHGGSDDINWKPNYYSVMSYFYQTPKARLSGAFRLSYSDELLPNLNEDNLNEPAGIGSTRYPSVRVPYCVYVNTTNSNVFCDGAFGAPCYRLAALGAAGVDWNNNGAIDSGMIISDINAFDISGFRRTVLQGYNDWEHLQYDFKSSPYFSDGVSPTGKVCNYNADVAQFLRNIPSACVVDIGAVGGVPGSDGIVNNNDFIVFINWYYGGDMQADFGMSGGLTGSDGYLNNNDFTAFINLYFAGCP